MRTREYAVREKVKMAPAHPGELLRETVIPEIGISMSDFARRIGVSRQTVYRILSESHGITPEMALRIGKFIGNGPDLWLRMQQTYDLWEAAQALDGELSHIHRYEETVSLSF